MAGSGAGKQRSASISEEASRVAIEKMYKIYEQLNSSNDKSLVIWFNYNSYHLIFSIWLNFSNSFYIISAREPV